MGSGAIDISLFYCDGEGELEAVFVAEERDGERVFAFGVGEEAAEEFAFGEAVFDAVDLDEDVVFLEAGAFSEAVGAVLAEAFDPESEALGVESTLGAGGVVEVFEHEAAGGHAAQGPGADAAGDVGFVAPVGFEGDGERYGFAVAAECEWEGACGGAAVKDPGGVCDGDEGLVVEGVDEIAGLQTGFGGGGVVGDLIDAQGVGGGKGHAEGFGGGHGVDEFEGNGFVVVMVGSAEGIANLMAVDAAFDDIAFPVELAAIAFGEFWDVDRRAKGSGAALFAKKGIFVAGIRAVEIESAPEGAGVGFEAGVLRVFLVLPGAVATVDGAVGIEDESGEGKVVVELEELQVDGVGVDEADADELIEEGRKVIGGEHGGVHAHAGEAGDAAEDDEEGFAGFGGFGEALFDVVVDPAGVVFHFGAVIADGAFAIFDGFGEG